MERAIGRRTFILLGGGAATVAALGTGGLLWRERRRQRRRAGVEQFPPLEAQALAQLGERETFDYCIVGSGIAAAVLASALADAGFTAVLLESGYHPRSSRQADLGKLDLVEESGSLDYPVLTTRLRALGGTTNVWTGNCYRFHPLDLDANPYAAAVAPWPISYRDIEPWYARAEKTLRVRGGLPSKFTPPRSNALEPYLAAKPDLTDLGSLFARAGVELEAFPVSQTGPGDREPVRSLKSFLPPLAANPRVRLVSGATVTRLVTSDSGEIAGAQARALDGTQRTVRATTYILAAGAIESARLLLLSTSSRHPRGLGNRHGFVGRGFLEHVAHHASARIPGRRIDSSRRARCFQFHEDFLRRELGGMWFTVRQQVDAPERLFISYDVPLSISAANRVSLSTRKRDAYDNPVAALSFSLSSRDEHAYSEARRLVGRLCGDIGAVDVRDEPGYAFAHHHMGTCRMGADPETSVVNRDLMLHEIPNTYVLGSSVFASSGTGHPTLLIVALAHRLVEHLLSKHAPGPGHATAESPGAGAKHG